MKSLSIRRAGAGLMLATVVTTTSALLGVTAAAGEADVPSDVRQWFAEAGSIAHDVLVGDAHSLYGRAPDASVFAVGEPVGLHEWSNDFLEGESDPPASAATQWVAPLLQDGHVVGTIAAHKDRRPPAAELHR